MAITKHSTSTYGKMYYKGLSTDDKSTIKAKNDDEFYEWNTSTRWMYNDKNLNPVTNDYWWDITSASGSVSDSIDGGTF